MRVAGTATVPYDATPGTARLMRIEVRDTTMADVPAPVVALQTLVDVHVAPGVSVPFSFEAPAPGPGRSFSLRVHVSLDGTAAVRPGDLLTTLSIPVGGATPLAVSLERVR